MDGGGDLTMFHTAADLRELNQSGHQPDHIGLHMFLQQQQQQQQQNYREQFFLYQQRQYASHENEQAFLLPGITLPPPPPSGCGFRLPSEGTISPRTRPTCPHQNYAENNNLTVPDSAQILYPRDDMQSRVRFSTTISVYDSSTSNWDEIIEHGWYSKDDLVAFKGERRGIIRMLRSVNFDPTKVDTVRYDLRGLEAYQSPSFNKLIQTKRKEVLHAVLEEQRRQKCRGEVHDVNRIRLVSSEASSWATSRALHIANDDADEVGCRPATDREFLIGSMTDPSTESFYMDIDVAPSSMPSLCGLSCGSASTTASESTDDLCWAEKLMGEDLIPET